MLPLAVQPPSVPESNSSSLLHPSAKGITSDFKSFFSTSTCSEKTKRETNQKLSSSIYQSLVKSSEMEKPPTNDQICKMIIDRLSEIRSTLSSRQSLSPLYRDDRLGSDWNNSASLYTTSTSYRDAQRESLHRSTAREPLDRMKSNRVISGLTPKPKDEGDSHLTEHLDTKNEERGSEVFTPSAEVTEKLENRDGVPLALGVMAHKKRGDANLKPVHVTRLDRKSTEDEQQLHTAGDVKLVRSVPESFTSTTLTDGSESAETGQKCSKISKMVENVNVNMALCENEHNTSTGRMAEEKPLVDTVRDSQYDDISDEDLPGGMMMDDEDKKTDKSLCSENVADVPEVSEPSFKKYSHEQVQVKIKSVSDERIYVKAAPTSGGKSCSYPHSVEADDDDALGWQTNHSHSPCIVLEGEHEIHSPPPDDDDDDDDDDGWEVIPVSIFNLEFVPGEQSDLKGDAEYGVVVRKPVPASAFSQMEIFDTPVEQEQALKFGQLSFVMPSVCGSNRRKSHSSEKRNDSSSEAEESNETEDSCDYSSGPEGNFLTVSRQLMKNLPASSRRQEADVITLDSDDEIDCMKRRRKRSCSSPCSENSGATKKTRHFPQTVEDSFQNTKLPEPPEILNLANVNLSQTTEQHGVSRQMNLNDNTIITILSDSDE